MPRGVRLSTRPCAAHDHTSTHHKRPRPRSSTCNHQSAAGEPVDHLDRRGKISETSPGHRHRRPASRPATRMAGRLKQPIGQQVRSTGAGERSTQEERQGVSGRQASGTEAQSTCSGARSRRHARQARSAGSSKHYAIPIMSVRCFVGKFVGKNCPPVRVTRTSLRSGFYFCSLTFEI